MSLFAVCYLIIVVIMSIVNSDTPNILFILIDDLGWNDLSYHDGCDYPTPNIDKLSSNALQLTNYYIQHICSPTRSALMSGIYPIHTGLQHDVIPDTAPYGLPLDLSIIPQDLKKAGYDTHMVGKWHIGFFQPEYTPTYRGFDTFVGYYTAAEDYYYHNCSSQNNDHGYDLRNDTNPVIYNGNYSTYLYGNETLRILNKYNTSDPEKRFFIYLPFQSVHSPLEAPKYIINSFNQSIPDPNRRIKAAMSTVLDNVIKEIIDFLKIKTNLWNNLLLIFSTDNGAELAAEGNNFPLRGGKHTLWEGGVKGIGFITGGWLNKTQKSNEKRMNALMHITDWYPTLCDIVGVTPTNKSVLDGYSQLNNIINGVTNIYAPRSEILHNIDPIGCTETIICGSLRMNEYKISIGYEVSNSVHDDLCYTTWCPLNETNENYTTIQCSENNGNYGYPVVDKKYMETNCPYNNKACLYNIIKDPCEYYDIGNNPNYTQIYKQMYDRLLYYNSTMVTPLIVNNPPDPQAANPKNFGGFWTPWIGNFSDKVELV